MIDFEKYNDKFANTEIGFLKAVNFIAEKVYIGVKRKYSNDNYIVHPEAVAIMIMDKIGCYDVLTIAVALLHDVFEESLTVHHKEGLVDLLDGVTKNIYIPLRHHIIEYSVEYAMKMSFMVESNNPLENAYNKAIYLGDMANSCDQILLVKSVDRLCNIKDFYDNGKLPYAKKYFVRGEILFGECLKRSKEFLTEYNYDFFEFDFLGNMDFAHFFENVVKESENLYHILNGKNRLD